MPNFIEIGEVTRKALVDLTRNDTPSKMTKDFFNQCDGGKNTNIKLFISIDVLPKSITIINVYSYPVTIGSMGK